MGVSVAAAAVLVVVSALSTISIICCEPDTALSEDEARASTWLQQYDKNYSQINFEATEKDWLQKTNIKKENQRIAVNAGAKLSKWRHEKAEEAKQFNWTNFHNKSLVRLFRFAIDIGTAAMKNKTKLKQLKSLIYEMETIYSTAKVRVDGKDHPLGSDQLFDVMKKSRDPNRLLQVWKGWREATGVQMKPKYEHFVSLSNEAIRDLGHADTGEYWRSAYESPTFQEDLVSLLDQLNPLYKQLHAYVRKRLKVKYATIKFPQSGHIPAHLLGSLTAYSWNVYNFVQPYPGRSGLDVTAALQQQNYTVLGMFKTAEEFFMSLGFDKLPQSFWDDSMFVKPADREVVCHPTAWDFGNAKDFRIKMCVKVNQYNFMVIHHEMGHIYYFLQYKHQPLLFRGGANDGFQEALGDTIALSVNTPGHLKKNGLLEEGNSTDFDDINFLMKVALRKIISLPSAYLADQWRWSVFAGNITPEHYNDGWWDLRCRYQGVSNPDTPSVDHMDAGTIYHVPANYDIIRYFVANVLQFQFHKALCKAAGHTGPLHKCDIYQSEPAGELLRSMMRKGRSIPWQKTLKEMTGESKIDASGILEYFKPLQDWLEKQNSGEKLGWTPECPQ